MFDRTRSARLTVAALTISASLGFVASTVHAQAGSQAMAFDPSQMASAVRFRYIGPVGNRTDGGAIRFACCSGMRGNTCRPRSVIRNV